MGTTILRVARWAPALTVLAVVVAGAGCTSMRPAGPAGEAWVRTELYFGLTKPGGALVTDAEWKAFLDSSVTPRFPDGLSVVQAQGRFRSQDQTLHEEPTGVLIILHPAGAAGDEKINALCREYVRKFDQESVLRSDAAASATFVTGSAVPAE